MSQLCTSPKAMSRLAVQFAAKSQGKLKTKATMLIASQWLKIGSEKYVHPPEEDGATPSMDLAQDENQFITANHLMSSPVLGEDQTVSEMSESTTPGDDDDESNVIFDSEDLDRGGKETSESRASLPPNSDLSQQQQSTIVNSTNSQSGSEKVIHSSESKNEKVGSGSAHSVLKKRSSHPELSSSGQIKADLEKSDPKAYSASLATLPDFVVNDSGQVVPSKPLSASVQGRSRTKSSAAAVQKPYGVASSASATLSRAGPGSITAVNIPAQAPPQVSSSAPQAIIRPPAESSPYVSYVDNDGPELPESAQHSLVYLAPNAFAIQTAAISGDEVAKLRAENHDKVLKISILGKQVSVLEKKLGDAVNKCEEASRKETELGAEVAALSRRVRKLRKQSKNGSGATGLSDSTLDEESTSTSSGGLEGSKSEGGGSKRRKSRKSLAHAADGALDLSDDQIARQQLWTPEKERKGVVILFAIAMLVLIFLSSPAFRSSLSSGLEQLGLVSPSTSFAGDQALLTDPDHPAPGDVIALAANDFSSAFASALNMTTDVES